MSTNPSEPPAYLTQDLIKIAMAMEPIFAERGMHLAIGGSCVYRGFSSKDMDVFIYPHSRETVMDKHSIKRLLAECGYVYVPKTTNPEEIATSTFVPDVLVTKHKYTGQRVDWFFLSRYAAA